MAKTRITGSAPVLLVKDVIQAAAYYRDKLGFDEPEIYGDPPNFCMASRDSFTVMLAQVPGAHTVVPHWKIVEKMWSAYFWVDDVEALYADFQNSGAIIDYSLYIAPWGVKEFGIQDIDGHDIGFGQVLNS